MKQRPLLPLLLLLTVLSTVQGISDSSQFLYVRCPSGCACKGTEIDCSEIRLSQVPQHLSTSVHRLKLQYNRIKVIRRNDFKNLGRLKVLQLQNNLIERIEPGALSGLLSLERLRLDNNRLNHIPIGAFGQLPRLLRLNLSHNKIGFVGKGSLPVAPRLKSLQMNNNNIACVTESALKGMERLRVISLRSNNISTLPTNLFARMPSLKSLRLSRNNLNCDCRLGWLSKWLQRNPGIGSGTRCSQPAVLRGQLVAGLRPRDFQCSEDHKELYPSQCSMAEQPTCPRGCSCVEDIVRCTNLGLTEVPAGIPTSVQALHLENNKITQLRANTFKQYRQLRRLLLQNNKISKIELGAFNGLDNLYSLVLSNNEIRELPSGLLKNLRHMQVILLNANKITCVPVDTFAAMPNLAIISLYMNQIKSVANGTFNHLKSLIQLSLGKNPLICDCNMRWLNTLIKNKRNLNRDTESICASPERMQRKQLGHISSRKFRCRNGEADATRNAGRCDLFGECPAQCSCTRDTVQCSWARLTDLPHHLPAGTKHLKLNNNMIRSLPANSILTKLPNLETLDLSNNLISLIEPGSFRRNGKLRVLNLSANRLRDLERRMLQGLSQLKALQMSSNKVTCLNNDTFEATRAITMLSLSQNEIRCIMEGTFNQLKEIESLNLDMNPLHCNCHMKWLPRFSIDNYAAIKRALPRCHSPALLMHTPAVSLKPKHFVCKIDRSLGCHGVVPCCSRDAVSCDHRSFCPRGCNCDGTTVRCIGNSLSNIPDLLPVDTTHLFLSMNRLTHLNTSRLSRLRHLRLLDISHNRLRGLNARMFENLTSLESLTISFNQIHCVDRLAFAGLSKLSVLFLQGNNITSLPYGAFDNLTQLTAIGLHQNPIHCDCNVKWLINFFREHRLDNGMALCHGPLALARKPIFHSRAEEFVCSDNSHNNNNQGSITGCNACHPNPCNNGGSCKPESYDRFTCHCRRGFTGSRCQRQIDACFGNPCRNQATCVPHGLGRYSCKCAPGFTGVNCHVNIDDCEEHECKNNATCIDKVDNYTCSCKPGFVGAFCEQPVDYCIDFNPCLNEATCLKDGYGGYRCICAQGWEGKNCEVNINDCNVPGVCLNGGTCVDAVGSFSCRCRPGYSGQMCQTLELPGHIMDLPAPASPGICTHHGCLNGGRCVQQQHEYRCQCMPGYEGKKCEKLTQVGFFTDSYARIPQPTLYPHANITLLMATKQRQGIVLYAGSESQFLMISLFDGYLRFSYSLGVPPGANAYSFVRVNDGRFHRVAAIVMQHNLSITVDELTRNISASWHSDAVRPRLDGPILVGALPSSEAGQLQHNVHIKQAFSFGGCVKEMLVNNRLINFKLNRGNSHRLIEGCPSFTQRPDPCKKKNLCKRRGRCVTRPDLPEGFRCECRSNYYGNRCQKKTCKRLVSREYYTDPSTGCKTTRKLKMRRCSGKCSGKRAGYCCQPKRTKRRSIRFICPGGRRFVKTVIMVRKCGCKPCGIHNSPYFLRNY